MLVAALVMHSGTVAGSTCWERMLQGTTATAPEVSAGKVHWAGAAMLDRGKALCAFLTVQYMDLSPDMHS